MESIGKLGLLSPKAIDALSQKLQALSDPTRLQIVQCLLWQDRSNAKETTVGELGKLIPGLAVSKSRLSFHLKELRLAGLIISERRGQHIYCRLNAAALTEVATSIGLEPSSPPVASDDW